MDCTCTTLVLYSTIWSLFFFFSTDSSPVDLLRVNQTIRDGDTIVSANHEFELGFFSPGSSTKRYVGMWFKKKSPGTTVWVANRDAPLNDTSGILMIGNRAVSIFDNATSTIIWSSNFSIFVRNPVAQLLDTGNLVVGDIEEEGDSEHFVWQSFDYIGDTILLGMKLGVDFVRGLEWEHVSWKSADDPSPGSFVHRVDIHGYPQLLLWKNSEVHARSGPWVGKRFSGDPLVKTSTIYINEFFIEQKEIYYKSRVLNQSSTTVATRLILTPNGNLQRLVWNDHKQEWTNYVNAVLGDCDNYGFCGPFSTCDISVAPRCACLRGFSPNRLEKWEAGDWTDGCVHTAPLDCGHGEGFTKYSGVKLPDTRESWYSLSMNLEECRSKCLKNCSCTAYSNTNVEGGGSGCLLWFGGLMDITGFTEYGQDIYVRVPASLSDKSKRSRVTPMSFILPPVVLTVISILIALYLFKKKRRKSKGKWLGNTGRLNLNDEQDMELPLFELKRVANATGNFFRDNKIGEGGFGPVYKGSLENGQLIAVKRLSENSKQGLDEFKNEVSLIAKLQHRNLVSLLGYCTEEGERILIYEFMPNKSLDSFIFDKEKSKLADWRKLYDIINGVARGLLYLHQDSKLRIIHRDLKASNVLLDDEMNPKISDFGMARSFGGSQTEANTTRVVGTYGYMPPEYVIDGIFSIKSDVYSFGVLVLEIVTGKKNRCFEHPDHNLNLLGHAWRCFHEQKLEELVDGEIVECSDHEVFRVIQIGLLSVQEYPEDRPDMSTVVLMLNSNTALPKPQHPGFFTQRRRHASDTSQGETQSASSNNCSITMVAPR
ncbi:hypothetical protein ACET3Z_025690 [Daucus carota]